MDGYIRLVLRRRALVLAGVVLVSVLAAASASRIQVGRSFGDQFFGDRPEYAYYLQRTDAFANDELIVVGLEDPEALTPAGLQRLRGAVEAVEALPFAERVFSVLSAKRLRGAEGELQVTSWADELAAAPERTPEILAELAADPFSAGLLVSRDGQRLAVVIELTRDPERVPEESPRLSDQVGACFHGAGYAPRAVHRAGFLPAVAESVRQVSVNLTVITPVVCVVLLLTVWILFRCLWPAALALGVAGLAALWMMGLLVAIQPRLSVMISMAPPVIIVVAFSDVVHLCSAYLLELGGGRSQREAIVATGSDVGRACLLTSATTFVGFLGIALAPTPVMRTLGLGLGFGVGVALLLALTVVPVLLSLFRAPKPLRRGTTGKAHAGLDRLLAACERLSWRRPRLVCAGFGLMLALSVWGLSLARMDIDMARRFDEDSPLTVATDWFERHFEGTNSFDLYVEAPEPGGLLDPGRLARVAALEEGVEALDGVAGAWSLLDVLRSVHAAIAPDLAAGAALPDSREAIAQYLLLFESAGGGDLEQLVDFDRRELRMVVRMRSGGTRATAATGEAARELGERLFDDGTEVRATGLNYLLGYFFEEILSGQLRGLAASFLAVMLMMMLGVRSARAGAVSMLPNALPVLALGGAVGLLYDQVDTDVIMLGILAVGIGVDDTIHFLVRYRLELGRHGDHAEAVRGTFAYAGRAIVMTTVILVLGFLPCAGSGFSTMRLFGTLLPFSLVVALLADLLLVPALVRLGPLRLRVPPQA